MVRISFVCRNRPLRATTIIDAKHACTDTKPDIPLTYGSPWQVPTFGKDSNRGPILRIIISRETEEIILASYVERRVDRRDWSKPRAYLCSTAGIDIDTGTRQ
jgi:hypothetical protein